MLTVSKTFKFDVAHKLPFYNGKCSKLHGHTMKLRVVVSGAVIPYGPCQGMVMDFNDLKRIVKCKIVDVLDHAYLNEITDEGFPRNNPTAEKVVLWITNILREYMEHYKWDQSKSLRLVSCRLWETEDSWAEVNSL